MRGIVDSLSKLKRRRSEENCPFCAINHSLNLNTDTVINCRFVIDTFATFYTTIKLAVQQELVTSVAFCIISLSPIDTSYHGTRPMLNGLLFVEYVTSALKLVRFHCFDAIAFECFIVCVWLWDGTARKKNWMQLLCAKIGLFNLENFKWPKRNHVKVEHEIKSEQAFQISLVSFRRQIDLIFL